MQGGGEYIHFGADDVEMHPGWWEQTVRFCDRGFLPAPRVLNTDGTLQSCGDWAVEMRDGAVPEFTRGPFVSRAQWDQLAPLVAPFLEAAHYFTDNVFTWAGRRLGMETVVCRRYEYTHHMAPQGRADRRMAADHELFVQYTQTH